MVRCKYIMKGMEYRHLQAALKSGNSYESEAKNTVTALLCLKLYEKMLMLAQFRCTAITLIFYKHISYRFRIKHHSTHLLYKDYVECYVTKNISKLISALFPYYCTLLITAYRQSQKHDSLLQNPNTFWKATCQKTTGNAQVGNYFNTITKCYLDQT